MLRYYVKLCVCLIIFTSSSCRSHDRELHLIPEGFLGKVVILYNQDDGVPIEYDKEGRRVYRIPESGILQTKATPNPGGFIGSDLNFYYVGENGEKLNKIPWVDLKREVERMKQKDNTITDPAVIRAYGQHNKGVWDGKKWRSVPDSEELTGIYFHYLVQRYSERRGHADYPPVRAEDLNK